MISATIREALDYQVEGYAIGGIVTGYTLYLIRDDDIVLYVGQSVNPLYRLQEHMGKIREKNGMSAVGVLIDSNAPISYQWTYELWKPVECLSYVRTYWQEKLPVLCDRLCADFVEFPDKDEAEEALIHHFKPCMNRDCNPNAPPLPAHYRYDTW